MNLGISEQAIKYSMAIPLISGIGALGFAFYYEIFQGYKPCDLCIIQRIPYVFAIIIGLWGIIRKRNILRYLAFAGSLFLSSIILAFYHVGVENYWWGSIVGCESALKKIKSTEELKDLLLLSSSGQCDNVLWSLYGISMAGYNLIFSCFLTITCFYVYFCFKGKNIG